jgi:hypothetical protein
VQGREGHVFADGKIDHKTCGPPILRDEEDTVANRRRRVGDLNCRSVYENLSGERRLNAEDRLRDFRPPGSDETGNAEDLTATYSKRHCFVRVAPGAQTLNPEELILRGHRP